MTPEDVRARVAAIERMKGDDEAAHIEEDELHQDVLRCLAARGEPLAIEALKTREIDFERWCA
jgi:hypothetical protein